jgi:cell division protein FtsQ
VPRGLIAAALISAVSGLLYLAARQTSMFALRDIVVRGAKGDIAAGVRGALQPFVGRSLVGLSRDAAERAVEALPVVMTAVVDRDFPHTLRVSVRAERAVAVVRQADDAWLVSARGRIMQRLQPGKRAQLPRVWLARTTDGLSPGTFVLADQGGIAIKALARLPRPFPIHVESAAGTVDALTLVLRGKTEVRLGEAENLRLKLRVAAAVLRSLTADERAALAYLDVSIPTRPVGGNKSQVETLA